MATQEEFDSLLAKIPQKWAENIGEILYTPEQIEKLVTDLAAKISADHVDEKQIVVVGLLKGCVLFFADITRKLTVPFTTDFICVSSYAGTDSTGTITLKKDLNTDVEGKHIIIIEDLIDTGNTLEWVQKHLAEKKPKSVKIACLLSKEERRRVHIDVDYIGDKIPDKFVVGYGMDYDEEYRCIPFIGVMKPRK